MRLPVDSKNKNGRGVTPGGRGDKREGEGGGSGGGGRRFMPRLELTPPDVLPLFEIGREKRGWDDAEAGDSGVDISGVSLVHIYGHAYCVEFQVSLWCDYNNHII